MENGGDLGSDGIALRTEIGDALFLYAADQTLRYRPGKGILCPEADGSFIGKGIDRGEGGSIVAFIFGVAV